MIHNRLLSYRCLIQKRYLKSSLQSSCSSFCLRQQIFQFHAGRILCAVKPKPIDERDEQENVKLGDSPQEKLITTDSEVKLPHNVWKDAIAKEGPVLFIQKFDQTVDCGDGGVTLFTPHKDKFTDVALTGKSGGASVLRLHNAIEPQELEWKPAKLDVSKLPNIYMRLSKIRLTGLVVITTAAGYVIAPGLLDLPTFFSVCVGTGLTSAAANAINQFLEVPYDSQMARTKARPIVTGMITPLHAVGFAATCAVVGVPLLALNVNPLTAALGAGNLALYTMVYTPLKRITIYNTWVGSVVGAIPPMMGWAACTGGLEPGSWLLAGILFAWQFPHFNALSWNIKDQYSRAGYRMVAVIRPDLCKAAALRYSVGMIGLCCLAPYVGLTTWIFAIDSLPFNLYLSYLAWRFYRDPNAKTSRKLFLFSLIHLPAIMCLLVIGKKLSSAKDSKKQAIKAHEVGEVPVAATAVATAS